MKRSKVNPSYKRKYGVTNWSAYNASLVRRGDIAVWISQEAIAAWTPLPSGEPGGQQLFSDLAIETALTLRLVFHLPLRQTQGFLDSLLRVLAPSLSSPDFSTLSRRGAALEIAIPPLHKDRPLHLIIDATGLKVFGRGEWAQAKHGKGTTGAGWRKFHLAVDESGTILAADLTEAEVADAAVAPKLIFDVLKGCDLFPGHAASSWVV